MELAATPALTTVKDADYSLGGEIGRRLEAVTEQWILPTPASNPAILEMFRDRDQEPMRDIMPWAGEFAGKYLTHAVQVYRLTRDPRLREHIQWFVKELASLQADDGYLGPWPADHRLTGTAPNCAGGQRSTWDAWGHYHIMLGLLLWHETAGDRRALACARRMGDLFCKKFLDTDDRLVSTGSEEMNLAPIHSLCLLYQCTGVERYLAMAHAIEEDFEVPPAGDYVRTALAGQEFFETPKPRWESLHPIEGIAELFFITGDEKYRRAFEHIWWSIVEHDRHNGGGFSSGEQATGNPYHQAAIETCCTVAWMAMSVDMLRMSGGSIVADELELSMLNSGLGMMSPCGRWVTYNTPMEGTRIASPTDATAFQARPGQPELNCCSVNGPRALGMLCDWAVMGSEAGPTLNYYGPGRIVVPLGSSNSITIEQETDYPQSGKVIIRLRPRRPAEFALRLRIPYWSAKTRAAVNGQRVGRAEPGRYLEIERKWKKDDTVELALDLSLHYWRGEKECKGKTSIYRGPILLAYDPRFNEMGPDDLPALDARSLRARRVRAKSWLEPWSLWEFAAAGGRKLRLCDYASAGVAGNPYRTWLKVRNAPKARYSRANPLRSGRP